MAQAKAKAKKKRRDEIEKLMSPKEQKAYERRAMARLAEIDEIFDARYAYAKEIFDMQPDDAKAAVWRMQAMMGRMARPRFVFEGQSVNVDPEILLRMQKKSHFWFAVRLLVALAKWDTQVNGFRLPTDKCADCLAPVKKVRAKKKSKR